MSRNQAAEAPPRGSGKLRIEFADGLIPVEVLDARMEPVPWELGVTEKTLPAGIYTVQSQLPREKRSRRFLTVVAGGVATCRVGVDPGDRSPLSSSEAKIAVTLRDTLGGQGALQFHALEGLDSVRHAAAQVTGVMREGTASVFQIRVADQAVVIAELSRGAGSPLRVALPATGGSRHADRSSCYLVLEPQGDHLHAEVRTGDRLTDLALRYLANGGLREASELIAHLAAQGPDQALAAFVVDYLLLRFGKEADVANFPISRDHRLFDLPDHHVVMAELAARHDDHVTAWEHSIQVGQFGLPVFTEGYAFWFSRLKLYANAGMELGLDESQVLRADSLFRRLRRLGPALDHTAATVTLRSKASLVELLAGPQQHRAVGLLHRAEARLARGQYEHASIDLTESLRLTPNNARALEDRGLAHLLSGDARAALDDLDRAAALDPNRDLVYMYRGIAHDILGNGDQALADGQQALALNPTSPSAHYNLGNTLLHLRRYRDAIRCYDEAIRLDPRDSRPHVHRGNALLRTGDVEGAIQAYTHAVRIDPRDAEAYANRGHAWLQRSDFEHAAADLERALQLKPDLRSAQTMYQSLKRSSPGPSIGWFGEPVRVPAHRVSGATSTSH